MPRYATVFTEFSCPSCGQVVDDRVDVQWGRLSACYELGDAVIWRRHADGRIVKPFTLYAGSDWDWNCGDPDVRNVFLLDVKCYAPDMRPSCPHCKARYDGVLVKVDDGRFTSVRPLLEGELARLLGTEPPPHCDIFVFAEDGSIVPKTEWVDKAIDYIENAEKKTPS